jgi:hypothetical protein
MKQDAWKRIIIGVGGSVIVLFAYGSGMRGQKKALEVVKQERRVLREDMRNLQLITRGREGLLHQYIALNIFDSQLSKPAKHGHELDTTVLKTAKSHLETSARLNATSDADVDDLIERLSNAKGSGDYADVAADLETPVTIKAPSLNDVPKQPGPEIGR